MMALPEIGGRRLEDTIANFEHRAKLCLQTEQERPNPDNALVAVLCDAVRLAREYADSAQGIEQGDR